MFQTLNFSYQEGNVSNRNHIKQDFSNAIISDMEVETFFFIF